jgi:small subunit ribosomal protein S3
MMPSRLAASIERAWYFRKPDPTPSGSHERSALGCEVVISGKFTEQGQELEKFVDIHKALRHPVEES